ncbi:MAG: hypothetical protein QM704_11165 [Anaeromyxobacteraceae bacterium]
MPSRRTSGWWRPAVALALALSASGAGGLVDATRPPAHHCRCHHGPDEDCDCTGCHRALEAAARDEALPPCHRAAAKARLARSARPPAHPCVKGTCGNEEAGAPRAPGHEPVVLPAARPALTLPAPRATPRAVALAGLGAARPVTPPPRA